MWIKETHITIVIVEAKLDELTLTAELRLKWVQADNSYEKSMKMCLCPNIGTNGVTEETAKWTHLYINQ